MSDNGQLAPRALYEKVRREAVAALGLNGKRLSAAESIRIEIVVALRLALDTSQGELLVGGRGDIGRLTTIAERLIELLPPPALNEPEATAKRGDDALAELERQLAQIRGAREAEETSELERAKGEIAELRGQLEVLRIENTALASAKLATAAAKPTPPTPAPPPKARHQSEDFTDQREPWRGHVRPLDAGGGGTSGAPPGGFTPRASWDRGGSDRGW